jgi:hypothetical protein
MTRSRTSVRRGDQGEKRSIVALRVGTDRMQALFTPLLSPAR